ncbi:transglutaminase-like domain-containing protein [Paradesertivirga mongoliensis]|uniref:Transglutaminase-like domain-containing protein n=1 Tax=Paradesertivirga mongoliensis TaxID=2100740 RepID=A0ABW4ZHC8_9SPHI|nr:transglutaminase-like domain-containing protein [Pedobacter mongoliensis]
MINNKELESLIKLLDDPDEEIAQHVEEKLLSYGNEVIEYLESAWEQSFDAVLQERIENLVHKIQYHSVKKELELWYHGGAFDLLQGVIILNKYQYPDMDPLKIINQIEEIKREIWLQMVYDMSAIEKVKIINHVLYSIYNFSGNTTNHQDPQNSYISQVLESKKGNQISLAIIYSVIAQKLDIPIYGVNLPQHFILAYIDEAKEYISEEGVLFYINAFNKGFIFSRKDVDSFLKQLNLTPAKEYYEPCKNEDIIRRILRNLISSYSKLGYDDKVKEIEELLAVVETEK